MMAYVPGILYFDFSQLPKELIENRCGEYSFQFAREEKEIEDLSKITQPLYGRVFGLQSLWPGAICHFLCCIQMVLLVSVDSPFRSAVA